LFQYPIDIDYVLQHISPRIEIFERSPPLTPAHRYLSKMTEESKPPTITPQQPEKKWYFATCHCKAVQYKAYLPVKLHVNRCSCTICTKLGYLLVYPSKDDVEWLSGYETLKNYRFGPKIQDHKFCPSCSASIGIDAMNYNVKRDMWRMNVRVASVLAIFRDD
jgi:hypothetical protein